MIFIIGKSAWDYEGEMPMDKPHRQVVTTYPVAIKYGQGRMHVPNPIPWHAVSQTLKCPDCDVIYILTDGFSRTQFFNELKQQHQNGRGHPDYIPSEPVWTSDSDCNCGM